MAEMVLAVCKLIGLIRSFVNIIYSHVGYFYSEVLVIEFQNTLHCVSVEMFELYQALINPLKPSGHYTHHQFNTQQFYILPTQCIYVFCMDLRTNSDYFPIQH